MKAVNLAIDEINAAGGAAGKKLEADFITYPGTVDTAVDNAHARRPEGWGDKYELIIQNHEGKPASAIEAAKKLVEEQGVSFFTGLNPSTTSLAIELKMPGLNALFVDATAASNDLTGKGCTPN